MNNKNTQNKDNHSEEQDESKDIIETELLSRTHDKSSSQKNSRKNSENNEPHSNSEEIVSEEQKKIEAEGILLIII